jgi:quercetin dioxygenase-like cupin family protein
MLQPELVLGNIFIRPNHLERKGAVCAGHTHNFDHVTIVFAGSVHVAATLPDGRVVEQDFTAPAYFLVKKDVLHEITALEDNSIFWCVYAHRDPQGRVTQEVTGFDPAYG